MLLCINVAKGMRVGHQNLGAKDDWQLLQKVKCNDDNAIQSSVSRRPGSQEGQDPHPEQRVHEGPMHVSRHPSSDINIHRIYLIQRNRKQATVAYGVHVDDAQSLSHLWRIQITEHFHRGMCKD